MHSPSTPAARRRRGATAVGALAVSGALLLSPALTAASAAPANAVQADAAQAAASQLTLSDTTFAVGDSITAEYATDRPTERNWVAVYPASAEMPCSGCGFAWDYAPGESGSVSIPLNDRSGDPLPAGDYRLEYLYDDGWTRVGEPVSFTIEGDVAVPDPEQSQPGDPAAPVEIDPVATDVSTDGVIHREGFSIEGAPEGWTVESETDAGRLQRLDLHHSCRLDR